MDERNWLNFDMRSFVLSLSSAKKAQPPQRRRGARNPVKQLAARQDILSEYMESSSGVAQLEMQRIKREQS